MTCKERGRIAKLARALQYSNNPELSSPEETRWQFNGGTGAIKLGIDVHQDFCVGVARAIWWQRGRGLLARRLELGGGQMPGRRLQIGDRITQFHERHRFAQADACAIHIREGTCVFRIFLNDDNRWQLLIAAMNGAQ